MAGGCLGNHDLKFKKISHSNACLTQDVVEQKRLCLNVNAKITALCLKEQDKYQVGKYKRYSRTKYKEGGRNS